MPKKPSLKKKPAKSRSTRKPAKRERGRPIKPLNVDQPKSITEVAAATGLDVRQLYRLRANGQIEPRPDGSWDLDAVKVAATARAERLSMNGASNDANRQLVSLKAQNLEATTKLKQITVARLAGKLVPWDDIVQEWNQKLVQLNSNLKRFGRDVSPLLEEKDMRERQAIIDEHLRKALEPIYAGPTKPNPSK